MPDGTDQPHTKDTPATPREDRTATEPATVERCAEDYASGDALRHAHQQQDARARAKERG
ncbi:hypothetical protein [Streptomyces boncukensis]|uniref:Uncharacterized protein n=1 Tax=Streptomyces boncukensis TaxID=2711219 RepID=A0A6G4X9V4_9ACTN|nr:hypothetical protein [Streptomyces boncukensis]NGO73534.1 hypothetical protein [Streptomyces boncukensis]